ncbi:MAG: zinc-dependent alcohol dehydrogenase family protein [Chloroflexi bacterium]|nr:MAG: alcohol dehydrogenase [Actinobacteria bacterium 13_2_20CM_2_66_6]TMD36064.1 MAG: zinc-dependent alcohol dehydrogenase family protein [Chloroflexota bacterium]TMD73346.1 MAG: zinc-dependent alcohol dehydrogenase family protein [Chloroflexota bacterium]
MKAVVIEEPNEVVVKQVADPTPSAGEAVVKVEACGICGTDIHVIRGEFAPTRYPIIPGHEFCGEVVAIGDGVRNLKVGDFVAVDPSLYDGTCRQCRAGHFNLCENWNGIGVGRTDGACAEFVAVPATNAFRLPPDLPRNWGTLVEPLSCAVHGLDMVDAKVAGDYLIYGAGTMGLLLAQLAKDSGASRLDMVETNPRRHELARRLAADRIARSADELDMPQGWDVVIDATGVVPAIEDGLTRVARGGTFLMFGVAKTDASARFSPFRVYNDEIKIVGSMAVLHSFERALALFARGVIDSDAMITDRFPLDQYPRAIDAFLAGSGLKVQVSPQA